MGHAWLWYLCLVYKQLTKQSGSIGRNHSNELQYCQQ